MKFASIVPVEYDPAKFSDYHLILAHEVLENKTIREYFQGLRGHTIILDNSVIELGSALDQKMIDEASKMFPDAYLVLPDELRDMDKTVWLVNQYVFNNPNLDKVMVVHQGGTDVEWIQCLEYLIQTVKPFAKEILVGIGRLYEDYPGGREHLYNLAMMSGTWTGNFHLLGIQHRFNEVYWAIHKPNILGVDSSLPGRAALLGQFSDDVLDLRKAPDLTSYVKEIHDAVQQQMKYVSDVAAGVLIGA